MKPFVMQEHEAESIRITELRQAEIENVYGGMDMCPGNKFRTVTISTTSSHDDGCDNE